MEPHQEYLRDRDNLLHQLDLQHAYWEEKVLPRLTAEVLSDAQPHYENVSMAQRKRKRDNLTEEAKAVMMGWINAHIANPYPTKEEK